MGNRADRNQWLAEGYHRKKESSQAMTTEGMESRLKLHEIDCSAPSPAVQLSAIYRVPQAIRRTDELAYEPEIVSIGPYHWGKERLKAMEKHKSQYLDELLLRNSSVSLENLLHEVKKVEEEAQSWYAENISMRSSEFAWMMVLDGCFLIELFLKNREKLFTLSDPIYGIDWVLHYVTRDVLLAENQLPFFVLRLIYSYSSFSSSSLDALAMDFFRDSVNFIRRNSRLVEMKETHGHLLHLLHSNLLPPQPESTDSVTCPLLASFCPFLPICNKWGSSPITPPAAMNAKVSSDHLAQACSLTNTLQKISQFINSKILLSSNPLLPVSNNPVKNIPSAKRLEEAGIKFKIGANCLDIKFSKGEITIPYLYVEDSITTLFRNLIAFEHRCVRNGLRSTASSWRNEPSEQLTGAVHSRVSFTAYACFMDLLVNTSDDVEVLHKAGILEHRLGSNEEVAELFSKMCKGLVVPLDNGWFSKVTNDVLMYYNTRWHQWKAKLFRDYFGTPWSVISFFAAVVWLGLTVLQTIYIMKIVVYFSV